MAPMSGDESIEVRGQSNDPWGAGQSGWFFVVNDTRDTLTLKRIAKAL